MATTALMWLPLEDMKEELRLDTADTFHDQLITNHILTAIEWMEGPLQAPFSR